MKLKAGFEKWKTHELKIKLKKGKKLEVILNWTLIVILDKRKK